MLHYMPQSTPLWIALTDYARRDSDREHLESVASMDDLTPEETGLIVGWEIDDEESLNDANAVYLRTGLSLPGLTWNPIGISDDMNTAAAVGASREEATTALANLLRNERDRARALLKTDQHRATVGLQ